MRISFLKSIIIGVGLGFGLGFVEVDIILGMEWNIVDGSVKINHRLLSHLDFYRKL